MTPATRVIVAAVVIAGLLVLGAVGVAAAVRARRLSSTQRAIGGGAIVVIVTALVAWVVLAWLAYWDESRCAFDRLPRFALSPPQRFISGLSAGTAASSILCPLATRERGATPSSSPEAIGTRNYLI